MEMTKTKKIIISALVVIILLTIYISFDRKSKNESINKLLDTEENATTTDSTGGIKTIGTGGYKIEQVGFDEPGSLPQAPNLDRESVIYPGATISSEARTVATEKIKILQSQLKTDQKNVVAWNDLGIYQKQAGDYEGAILSWKYSRAIAPRDYVSVANLGNLYAYFLKDNAQAEMYYIEAISKGPTQVYLYTQLAEIYRDIFKDLDRARAIVNQGLSKIPNDQNLLQLKDLLK